MKTFQEFVVECSQIDESSLSRIKSKSDKGGMAIFFAIKDAIASVGNYTKTPELNAPATPEAILLSIMDLKSRL